MPAHHHPELVVWCLRRRARLRPRGRLETPARAMRGGARPRPREIIEEFRPWSFLKRHHPRLIPLPRSSKRSSQFEPASGPTWSWWIAAARADRLLGDGEGRISEDHGAMRGFISARASATRRASKISARPRPREIIEEFPTVELSEAISSALDPLPGSSKRSWHVDLHRVGEKEGATRQCLETGPPQVWLAL
jgi:hypothetical protein